MACKLFVTSKSGFSVPALGLGTWQSTSEECELAINAALSSGYRYIDTAYFYKNEKTIGKVLKEWMDSGKIKREDLFVVTKLPFTHNEASEVEKLLDSSLENLQLEYVDIYLIHTPFTGVVKDDGSFGVDNSTDIVSIYKEMEKQVDRGKAKAIGVSNFSMDQVERILEIAKIPPVTNQIEIHAYLQQPELVKYLESKDIIVTGYSPLGSPGSEGFFKDIGSGKVIPNIMENPVVLEISEKYKKSPAQVLLRHLIQKNISVIPKSVNPERIAENIKVFDFELTPEEMKKMDGLDCNKRVFNFRDIFFGVENHPEYPFKNEL